jgi:hypothetical protein
MKAKDVHQMNFAFDMQGAQSIVNDPFVNGDERTGCRWTFTPNNPQSSLSKTVPSSTGRA